MVMCKFEDKDPVDKLIIRTGEVWGAKQKNIHRNQILLLMGNGCDTHWDANHKDPQ